MKLLRSAASVFVLLAAVVVGTAPASAQTHAIEHRLVPFYSTSGALDNASPTEAVVYSELIEAADAEWLRLTFRRVELGLDSHLRLTALEDGAMQRLYPVHLQQWQNTSAYFNGSAVLLELVAGPSTVGNAVEVSDLYAGTIPAFPKTQCGPTDDRVASDEPERARLLDIGCTAWMYNEESCFASAGHCVASAGLLDIVEFNVPLSNSNGSINHPGPEDQYAVDKSEVPFSNGGQGNDWGLFRVFPNSETGLMPFEAQGAHLVIGGDNPPLEETISVVGYGVDSGTANQTQQISFGPLTTSTTTLLQYQADTQGGNSGSGVVWEATGEAVAIHTHGGCGLTGGANVGTAVTHPAFQAALDSFCPAGGGGGIPCGDLHNFIAVCRGPITNQFLLTGVLFDDASHNGKTVTLRVDGQDYDVTVVERLARLEIPGITSGKHEVVLVTPGACVPPKKTTCG